jgi:hypothetical protein
LIEIKAVARSRPTLRAVTRETAMPTESILVIAGILLAFSLFAATLAWVDFTTPKRSGSDSTPAE